MGKSFPDPEMAHHDGSAQAFPDSYLKVVPSVPASQSDRPQLRPVLPTPQE